MSPPLNEILHGVREVNCLHAKNVIRFACARNCRNIGVSNALLLNYILCTMTGSFCFDCELQ